MGPSRFFTANQELQLLFRSSVTRPNRLANFKPLLSLGAFEKVKLYKVQHLVEMTVADNQPGRQLATTAGRTTFKAFPSPLPVIFSS
jgi:hypothetical protein